LRINLGVKAVLLGESDFDWISRWVPTPGTGWQGVVECFVARKVDCLYTTDAVQEGYEHPWAILTDLAPDAANVAWYGLRSWVECGFKDFKRGAFGWHHEKMQDAGRVERLWLAMAVAMVWMVSLGTQAESQLPAACPEHLPEQHIARKRHETGFSSTSCSSFELCARGRLVLLAALLQAQDLPVGRLLPENWPETLVLPKRLPPLANCDSARNNVNANVGKRRLHAVARLLPSSCLPKTYT